MNELNVASLLCSRICHDLVSPVGAITNGLEVLEDDNDPEMQGHALSLIGMSAESAAAKLKFMRIAFGAASTLGNEFSAQEIGDLADGIVKGSRVNIDCSGLRSPLGRDQVKLLLNMILLGIDSLPRGGTLTARSSASTLDVQCAGTNAALPEEMTHILNNDPGQTPDHRSVVAYVALQLAQHIGWTISLLKSEECITLTAKSQ